MLLFDDSAPHESKTLMGSVHSETENERVLSLLSLPRFIELVTSVEFMGRVGFMKANLCLAANYGWTLR